MNNDIDKIIDKIVDAAGQLAGNLNLSRIAGQIYAMLYMSSEPLSLDYITERLKVSKGNISVNIRELEKWDAVKRVWIKGSRKDYYEANTDIIKIVLNRLKVGLTRRLNDVIPLINEAEENFKKVSKNHSKEKKNYEFYQRRIKKVREMHSIINNILQIMPSDISVEKLKLLQRFKII